MTFFLHPARPLSQDLSTFIQEHTAWARRAGMAGNMTATSLVTTVAEESIDAKGLRVRRESDKDKCPQETGGTQSLQTSRIL